ncbi:hypothetical protein [Kangiella taiwanensis]|uniref:DUF4426 domain-containing protein n=1 Tax=Kangiella taiwanensis TaxID=1079179 RepID=A0ABP8HYC9_9GAMM|nr:hypothetical protein [Kangiella taiwanensis]
MNTNTKFKQVAFAAIAMLALGLSTNLKADQPTEPLENVKLFGVIHSIDTNREVRPLQPSSSSIKQERYDGLTVLTLSQTFTNDTDDALNGYYHIPLPNPGALINYSINTDKETNQLSDPQKLALNSGETITYTVRYELNSNLLVGFHQTSDMSFSEHLNQSAIAQN